ncbi:MAG: alpha/beta fold hydrolase [Proteobacteria bacterium]|nr:alpha/beta fold hydrolase [Pseudomonadota bacterium]
MPVSATTSDDPAPHLIARTADGVGLAIDRIRAQGPARATVVCLHAMMTDGRYFGARRPDGFAAALAARGLDVYVADFRGHGRSDALADWSFDDLVELDLPAIVGAVAADAHRAPGDLVILGHSLGGLVTTAALGARRIASPRALLLASTSVWLHGPRGPLARRAIMMAYRGAATLLGRAPIRRLGLGSVDEPSTYVRQLTGWARAARWTSLRGHDYGAALANLEVPTFPFASTGDWMCTPADAVRFADRIPTAAKVKEVGKRHGDPMDPDHFALIRDDLPRLREWIVDVATR